MVLECNVGLIFILKIHSLSETPTLSHIFWHLPVAKKMRTLEEYAGNRITEFRTNHDSDLLGFKPLASYFASITILFSDGLILNEISRLKTISYQLARLQWEIHKLIHSLQYKQVKIETFCWSTLLKLLTREWYTKWCCHPPGVLHIIKHICTRAIGGRARQEIPRIWSFLHPGTVDETPISQCCYTWSTAVGNTVWGISTCGTKGRNFDQKQIHSWAYYCQHSNIHAANIWGELLATSTTFQTREMASQQHRIWF